MARSCSSSAQRTRVSRWRGFWGALCLGLGASGCLGGQTGTEESKNTGGESACKEEATALAATQLSSLGFSTADAARVASGERSAELSWATPDASLSFGPEQGASSVVLELVPDLSTGRLVHSKPRTSNTSGVGVGECPLDEVRFDAELRFETAGGAFHERQRVVVHAIEPEHVSVRLELPWSQIQGSFTVSPAAGFRVTSPVISFALSADESSGNVTSILEQMIGSGPNGNVSARSLTYACWPSASATCASR